LNAPNVNNLISNNSNDEIELELEEMIENENFIDDQ